LIRLLALAALLAAATCCAQERAIPLSQLRSGITFAGNDVRAMQNDDGANPGLLWVQQGETLWQTQGCSTCHGDARAAMKGVAARYPAYDATSRSVLDLDARIEQCRTTRQKAPAFGRESDELLSLAAYVAFQSRGMPYAVSIDGGPALRSIAAMPSITSGMVR